MSVVTTKTRETFSPITTGVACVVNAMKVFSKDQIVVYVGTTTDEAVLDTDYSLSIAVDFSGCTVTPLAPLTARATAMTVARRTPLTSTYALAPGGKLSEQAITEQLDRQILRAQEVDADKNRAVRAPVSEGALNPLAAIAARANRLLGFDAGGQPVAASATGVLPGTITDLELATGSVGLAELKSEVLARLGHPDAHLYDFLPGGTDPLTVTNWSPYLNAAAASGKVTQLPDRDLLFNEKIVGFPRVGGGFIGEGYKTRLRPTFDGEYMEVGDDIDGYIGQVFHKFRVWPTVAQTGDKAAIRCRRATQMVIGRVWMGSLEDYGADGHRIRHGFAFDRFAEVVMLGQGQIITQKDGVRMHGGNDGLFGAEFLIDERYRFLHCEAAIHIGGGCGGVYVGSVDTSLCGIGVNITKALASIANREVFLGSETVLDVSTNYNLNVEGSAVYRVMIEGSWLASCSNPAGALIRSAPMTDSLKPIIHMVGGRLFNSQGDAAQLSGCRLILTGVEVTDNGLGAGGGHGIWAPNPAVELLIRNCPFKGTGNGTKGNAVNAVSGVTGVVEGCDFETSGQAHIANASATLDVRRNRGWKTEAKGQAQINGSAISVTFAHGLDGTPLVQITPRTILGASGAAYYRVTSDATNITVEANTTLNPTPWAFNWSAEVP